MTEPDPDYAATLRALLALGLLLCAAVLALATCGAPVLRSPLEAPPIPGCEAWRYDAVRQGERVSVGVSDGQRFWSLDFLGGELEDGAGLISGARVTTAPGEVCPAGEAEGGRCVVERWRSGACWRLIAD